MNRHPISKPSLAELTARLSRVNHFRDLKPEEIRRIIQDGQLRRFARDQVVFSEGEPAAGLHVLLSGKVQACKLSPQGQLSILAVFEPVLMFNEVAALDGGPNPVTVIALEDSLIWTMAGDALQAVILRYPALGLGILRVMANRNRRLIAHFEDLSFRSVLGRTAKLLLELSDQGSQPVDRRQHPNHQLAARIATVPEAFSRALKALREQGAIECSKLHIRVLKPGYLHETAFA